MAAIAIDHQFDRLAGPRAGQAGDFDRFHRLQAARGQAQSRQGVAARGIEANGAANEIEVVAELNDVLACAGIVELDEKGFRSGRRAGAVKIAVAVAGDKNAVGNRVWVWYGKSKSLI